MAEQSRKIGSMDCCVCGEVMPVRQNGRDTLNLSCPWCGHSSYAKGGTEAHRIVSGWIRHDDPGRTPPPVASVATGVASKDDAPAAPPAASIAAIAATTRKAFSLGDL